MKRRIRTPENFVVVSIDAEYRDFIKGKTLTLKADPEFDPERFRTTIGEVVGVPDKVTYCEPMILVGDKIHFHYNAIDANSRLYMEDGELLYRIPYWDIFCVEEEVTGELHPVPGWVLCDPIKIKHPLAENKLGLEIPDMREEEWDTAKAKAVYVGDANSENNAVEIKPGDIIYFEEAADFDNNGNHINGHRYFFIRHEDILARETIKE